MKWTLWLSLALIWTAGCNSTRDGSKQDAAAPRPSGLFASLDGIPSPAGPGSGQPFLSVAAGHAVLSWLEGVGSTHHLRYAERTPDGWAPASTVVEGDNFFVNWADVPSVTPLRDGRLAAHWLFRSGSDKYAYHVGVKVSDAARRVWSTTIIPHTDRTATEHGFVSFFDAPDGGPGLVWLDGRDFAAHGGGHDAETKGEMALRAVNIGEAGRLGAEMLVDGRVCDCCPTATARTDRGVVVAYRDRSKDEIRDISVTRYENGAWTAPALVHRDNWQISGCPVNGPALSSRGNQVALAWFSAQGNDARTMVAFSKDGGASFGAPVRADDGVSLGRVDVAILPAGDALVSWIDFNGGKPEFRSRRVKADGNRGESVRIAGMTEERASGYPRMALAGDEVLFAWTTPGTPSQVKTARARLTSQ